MYVYIVNFGYRNYRYFPMMELLLGDAISKRGRRHKVKICTVMDNDSHEKLIRRIGTNADDSITIVWETLASKSASYIKKCIKFANLHKKMIKTTLLVGGYWASTVSKHFSAFDVFDHIIEGYSAESIADAVDNWEITKGKRIIDAKEQIDWNSYELNLNFLDNPAIYFRKEGRFLAGYLSSIGCPNECSFCYNTVLRKINTCYSERTIEKVIQDLETLNRHYNYDTIQFKDLNFFYNGQRAFQILDYLKNKGKRIHAALDITVKDCTEDVFKKLSKYGIKDLWIGLESFEEESRRKMNKEYTTEKLEQVFSWADKYKIILFGNIMLGAPWQNRKYVENTISKALEYINCYKYVMVMFNTLRPVIGSPVQEEYFKDVQRKLDFDEMIDLFSFYMEGRQTKIYGEAYEFIDFEKVHNAFWFINTIKNIELRSVFLSKHILPVTRKWIEKQLTPPYFSSRCMRRLFLIKRTTKETIVNCLKRIEWLMKCGSSIFRLNRPKTLKCEDGKK